MAELPPLARPAQRALAGAGISRLEDLTRHTETGVAALHGMGPNAIRKIKDAMAQHSLQFAQD